MSLYVAFLRPAKVQVRLRKALLRRYLSTKSCDPLRILFCGSDEFSIASLQALHKEHTDNPSTIASIDVVCRPGKRVGRGLKKIREVPIKSAAQQLGVRVHEIDTFTGWTPPPIHNEPANLVVAVSFGLFIPRRILGAAKYGGLNVHPSLLPDFRGPAPLYHTLLAGDTRTGITLQTLHAENFDHGVLLEQTPYPGIEIPEAESCTQPQLVDFVAPLGAEMLLRGIRNRVFVQPVKEAGWSKRGVEGDRSARLGNLSEEGASLPTLRHAPKIITEDRHIKWGSWTAEEIMRRYRVLGPLWNTIPMEHNGVLLEKRVIFSSLVVLAAESDQGSVDTPGLPFAEREISKSAPENPYFFGGLKVKASDGSLIGIGELKVEGSTTKDGIVAAVQAGLFSSSPVCVAEIGKNREFRRFKEALR